MASIIWLSQNGLWVEISSSLFVALLQFLIPKHIVAKTIIFVRGPGRFLGKNLIMFTRAPEQPVEDVEVAGMNKDCFV